ncbi:hypothetical protein QTO34_006613 [Cnephaeus nilssonii]|uniref:Uncharacterized protein n=1 Tax=Cnephaeus nilssonii TaxID=3371016 RepID=A0AA40HKV8_CNENI|nr:hypothetical protein QTO34_006613 [Eptesicus nilssonii]
MDVLRLLLRYGANVNGSHSMCGWNALHQATFQENTEIIKLLLKRGASKECQDDFGITPLFVAAQYGKLESLSILISSEHPAAHLPGEGAKCNWWKASMLSSGAMIGRSRLIALETGQKRDQPEATQTEGAA